jgi:hypothetical protein
MNRIIQVAMISCRQAAILINKKEFDQLSRVEAFKLRLHTKLCQVCKDYEKQSVFLGNAIDQLVNQKSRTTIQLSEEQRLKILKVLEG